VVHAFITNVENVAGDDISVGFEDVRQYIHNVIDRMMGPLLATTHDVDHGFLPSLQGSSR
jgi:hypothetical protein